MCSSYQKYKNVHYDLIWYDNSNKCFYFLNNITRIFTYFFTYTYFHTYFHITKHIFLIACTKQPNIYFLNINFTTHVAPTVEMAAQNQSNDQN